MEFSEIEMCKNVAEQILGLITMVSSPIGLSEFWESEPMWICKNINSIHDQGRRYHYLDERRSK